ncbi:MAG TPA: hypothetical protein VF077_03820 [Nitrospiraceae bacterium]
MSTELKSTEYEVVKTTDEYSVVRTYADGHIDTVCSEVPAVEAASEFWRCTKNVSAMTGIVDRVAIVDGLDRIGLAWHRGRGYTFDGGLTYRQEPTVSEGLQ